MDNRLPLSLLLLTLTASQVPPTLALAQAPAEAVDTVDLTSGGFLRGLILELDPGSHVTIRLPSGEQRRLPWNLVRTASRDGRPVSMAVPPSAPSAGPSAAPVPVVPEAPPPPPPTAPPIAGGQEPGGVPIDDSAIILGSRPVIAAIPGPRVQIDADANVVATLQRRIGPVSKDESVGYSLICSLPCVVPLPVDDPQPYRIGNPIMASTEWFKVPPHDAKIRADIVSRTWAMWPGALLTGAIGTAIAGGIVWGVDAARGDSPGTAVIVLGSVSGALLLSAGIFSLVVPETSLAIEKLP